MSKWSWRRCEQSRLRLELAERTGFEPAVGLAHTRFPGVPVKPLRHLSGILTIDLPSGRSGPGGLMAERAGFEPAIPVARDTGFRNRRFQPLSHLSESQIGSGCNCKKPPGDDLFSHTSQCSIVSATTFHFRVRDGNGWFHRALITKGLLRYVLFGVCVLGW